MNDCENEVYTRLVKVLREYDEDINITGDYTQSPPSFPSVSIEMKDCYTDANYISSSAKEDITACMFEINVYTNKKIGRKAQAKELMQLIDKKMCLMNGVRISMTPVANLEDTSIYRLTARYRLKTDGKNFYRG